MVFHLTLCSLGNFPLVNGKIVYINICFVFRSIWIVGIPFRIFSASVLFSHSSTLPSKLLVIERGRFVEGGRGWGVDDKWKY